jgi:hypothetical protein
MLTQMVDVRSYDWNNLPACGFFEILGKRGTGKTSWTQYILQYSPNRVSGVFVIMAGSETAKQSWSKIVHPIFVVDPSLEYLEVLKDTQNNLVRHYQKNNEVYPDEKKITLVLDDVSSNKKLMRSQILSYLASNSRHLQMSIFILAQYHCQIVAEVRNQFDQVFMLSTSDKKSIERLHAEYCSSIDLRVFKHVLGHVTQNFGLMVIDNQSTSVHINDICFHAKMKTYPPDLQSLGAEGTRDYGADYYCDEDQSRPDAADADAWKKDQDEQQKNHIITDRRGKLVIRMS